MPLIHDNKLRNDQNRRITRSLFNEILYDEQFNFFTIKRWNYEPRKGLPDGLVSFPLTYLKYAIEDPTEYSFALEVFGDWEHWLLVQEITPLKDLITQLRAERDIAVKSKGFLKIAEEVASGGKNSYQAAKWLAEKGWEPQESSSLTKGKKAAKELAEEEERQDKAAMDMARNLASELGISIN